MTNSVVFPLFVLTHTMDVMPDATMGLKYRTLTVSSRSAFYRELLHTSLESMRDSLVDMGRPLWQRYKVAKGQQSRGGELCSTSLRANLWASYRIRA